MKYRIIPIISDAKTHHHTITNLQTQSIVVEGEKLNSVEVYGKNNKSKYLIDSITSKHPFTFATLNLLNLTPIKCLDYEVLQDGKKMAKYETISQPMMSDVYTINSILIWYEYSKFNTINDVNVYVISEFGIVRMNADMGGMELEGSASQILTIKPHRLTIVPSAQQNVTVVVVDHQTGFSSTSSFSFKTNN